MLLSPVHTLHVHPRVRTPSTYCTHMQVNQDFNFDFCPCFIFALTLNVLLIGHITGTMVKCERGHRILLLASARLVEHDALPSLGYALLYCADAEDPRIDLRVK